MRRKPEDVASVVNGVIVLLLPVGLAAAAWRTWVHARRYVAEEASGWLGVAEAGAVGFSIALLILSPGILTRPAQAPPYIIVYGGIALLVGLALGVILRTTAILVLIFSRTNRS
jgi:hypothetical protein